MKTYFNLFFNKLLITGVLISPPLAFSACSNDEIQHPEVVTPLRPDLGPEGTKGTISLSQIETSTAFESGTEAQSTRIPAIVTGSDGSLLVFCEGRHLSWKDVSYSDVLFKRSTDNGATWSDVVNLTDKANIGKAYAFMDPTPVVDQSTGKVFLFCTRHNIGKNDMTNRAMLVVSNDNGKTWQDPQDVNDMLGGSGFGPGSGIQIRQGRFAGRMLLNSRRAGGGVIIYSDDHGQTWKNDGVCAAGTSEANIAEGNVNSLVMNIRRSGNRSSTYSTDGGISWTPASVDITLPTFGMGCHASVFGIGTGMVLYCGPKGGVVTAEHDDRSYLSIYRSPVGGTNGSWTRKQQLTDKAAGYSDMTMLSDGRIAIAFEAGPLTGFGYYSTLPQRPAGWMRVDVLILPKEVLDYDYWFETAN